MTRYDHIRPDMPRYGNIRWTRADIPIHGQIWLDMPRYVQTWPHMPACAQTYPTRPKYVLGCLRFSLICLQFLCNDPKEWIIMQWPPRRNPYAMTHTEGIIMWCPNINNLHLRPFPSKESLCELHFWFAFQFTIPTHWGRAGIIVGVWVQTPKNLMCVQSFFVPK